MQHICLPRRTGSTMIFAVNKVASWYLVQALGDMIGINRENAQLAPLNCASRTLRDLMGRANYKIDFLTFGRFPAALCGDLQLQGHTLGLRKTANIVKKGECCIVSWHPPTFGYETIWSGQTTGVGKGFGMRYRLYDHNRNWHYQFP